MTENTRGEIKLSGKRVLLRPVRQRDYEALLQLETSEALGPAWRLRGRTPSPESYVQNLWHGVLVQFLAVERLSERVVGLLTIYNADPFDGHAYLSVAKFEPGDKSTIIMQGLILLLDYVFEFFAFRKLFLEVNAYNLDQFGSAIGPLLKEEGCLREYTYAWGRYWDKHILSMTREDWYENAPAFRSLVHGDLAADPPLGEVL